MAHELATDPPFGGIGRSIGRGEALMKGYFNFFPSETWNPPVNLYESENAYLVCVDLAGVDKDKIDLTVHENKLRLKGNRPFPRRRPRPCPSVEAEQGFCEEASSSDGDRSRRVHARGRAAGRCRFGDHNGVVRLRDVMGGTAETQDGCGL